MQYISTFAVPIMLCGIICYGLFKRVNVYETFIDGAMDGIKSLVKIIAPLIGLMVSISVFRASGLLDLFTYALTPVTNLINMPGDILPLALLRPISGSGSLAIVSDIYQTAGPDSISGRIASVMMGASETTFYTLTVYFGSVGIRKVRHTLKAALFSDLTAIIASVIVVQLLLR
ncbi:MAG: spore maturation protein [Oscillospiraceae bacterium]|nr:spore maturation protein [Oscillospiraceae bacterium]